MTSFSASEVKARIAAIDRLKFELVRQITRSHRLRQPTLISAFTGYFFDLMILSK